MFKIFYISISPSPYFFLETLTLGLYFLTDLEPVILHFLLLRVTHLTIKIYIQVLLLHLDTVHTLLNYRIDVYNT